MKRTLAILFVVFLWATGAGGAADRLRIGYSSISGAYVGIWVAHDAGFFAREGLDDQVGGSEAATQREGTGREEVLG